MPGRRRLTLLAAAGALALLAGGCYQEPVAITSFPPSEIPRVTILPPSGRSTPPIATPRASTLPSGGSEPTSPPPQATTRPSQSVGQTATVAPTSSNAPLTTPTPPLPSAPGAPASGPPSAGCVNGWVSPSAGGDEYMEGITILTNQMGVSGQWRVDAIRYFSGPDSPGVIAPRYDVVERWYVKAGLVDDPTFRGRWLLEKRTDQILGVAAVAPYETSGYGSPDWTGFVGEGPPRNYLGLPGQWSGIPYDFVTGEGDSGNPGLPAEVIDCLAGS